MIQKVKKHVAHNGSRLAFYRMNVTAKRGKTSPISPAPSDRNCRRSTASHTSASKMGKGPVIQKGRVQKNSSRKTKMEELLVKVFEIGVKDSLQPAAAFEFLREQVSRNYIVVDVVVVVVTVVVVSVLMLFCVLLLCWLFLI